MGLLIIGVNHKSASVAIREKLSVRKDDTTAIIMDVMQKKIATEAILVFTCNRTELYFYTESPSLVLQWFKNNWVDDFKHWKTCCYTLFDATVIKHIMRVACGLDSMVLGETEILGQLKTAYHLGQKGGGVGKWLDRLFQRAFATAKLVRTNTKIGTNSLSVAYISVRLAELIFADMCSARVLVIGAGDTARLIIKHLLSIGLKEIWIVNRSKHKARELAYEIDKTFCWHFLELEQLSASLGLADIVLSSTSSNLPIIGKGMVERAIKLRKNKPMLMVDVAVPRDIEEEVKDLAGVYLYCIDDLQTIAEKNRKLRQNEIGDAEDIISEQTQEFLKWVKSQKWVGAIKGMRSRGYSIRDTCLTDSLKMLQRGKTAEEALQYLAYNITNKFLHLPTVNVRQAGFAGDEELLQKLNLVFDLIDTDNDKTFDWIDDKEINYENIDT